MTTRRAILVDCHVHSTLSEDGESTPDECAAVAFRRGLGGLIFTEHLEFLPPPDYPEGVYRPRGVLVAAAYEQAVSRLRETWRGKLAIGMGVELGLEAHNLAAYPAYLAANRPAFDFVLGSLHAVGPTLVQLPDYTDPLGPVRAAGVYFERLLDGVRQAVKTRACDVIGHIDLVKRSPTFGPFRTADYVAGLEEILRVIIGGGLGLEVNTSGYRQAPGEPYPGLETLKLYRRLGGEIVTIGSDSHRAATVGLEARQALDFVRAAGLRYVALFEGRRPRLIRI